MLTVARADRDYPHLVDVTRGLKVLLKGAGAQMPSAAVTAVVYETAFEMGVRRWAAMLEGAAKVIDMMRRLARQPDASSPRDTV